MLDRLKKLWREQPARVVAWSLALAVLVLGQLSIVIDPDTLRENLELILPVLLGGELTRRKVTPVASLVDPAPDPDGDDTDLAGEKP